jgi:isoleucyl-tRNA synthetase
VDRLRLLSHVSVLDRHPELHCPADLYIEATDQHRGWFQSSLMMSIVARDAAPYKSVITHGFVVDTSGKKISKSDQGTGKSSKPMTADHYYNKYGGDMVRLWVSSVDYQNEVPFSEELFQQTGESYRRIRNTFRVLLGNLHDATPELIQVQDSSGLLNLPADYTLIDRWILERLHAVTAECVEAYAAYDFRKVFTVVNSFFATELSALYIDITKDRMYCDAANSPRRRATQAAIREITETLCKLLAPILAFTADETWEHLGHSDSVHMQVFPQPNPAFAGLRKSNRPLVPGFPAGGIQDRLAMGTPVPGIRRGFPALQTPALRQDRAEERRLVAGIQRGGLLHLRRRLPALHQRPAR